MAEKREREGERERVRERERERERKRERLSVVREREEIECKGETMRWRVCGAERRGVIKRKNQSISLSSFFQFSLIIARANLHHQTTVYAQSY